MKRRNTKQAAPSKPDLAPAPIPEPEATTAFTPPEPDPVLPAAIPLTPYGKAMALLTEIVNFHAEMEYTAPSPDFFKEYFQLSGDHMILTENGWEAGSTKAAYLAEEGAPELLDEVNAPGTAPGHTTEVEVDAKPETRTPGEIAYTAYCEHRGWKAFNGDPLPSYADMKPDPKRADLVPSWEAAGHAVLKAKAVTLMGAEIKGVDSAITFLETRLGHVLAKDEREPGAASLDHADRILTIAHRLVI